MKKILVLSTRFPYPVVGGDRLRIFQICKLLSRRYQLTLLCLCETKAEVNMPIPDDDVFNSVERVFMPRWRSWLNCILAIPSATPLQVAYYKNSKFYKRALHLQSQHDAILVHLIRAADGVKDVEGVKILEMTDAISMNYSRIRSADVKITDWRSYVFAAEASRLKKYERQIVSKFSHNFLVSDIDRQFLFGECATSLDAVTVSSNGVDFPRFPFQFSERAQDIVFIGNMCSLQNIDAANYMASEVFPRIRSLRPSSCLRLIGRIGEDDAKRLRRIEGVIVTGEVPDVAIAARNGAVGVCPLRLGAGVQNKVLEYMALGLPTVSTPLGLEGFKARDGVELLIANDAKSLSEAILHILDDRDFAKSIALAAKEFVETNHSWEAQLAPLVSKFDELIDSNDA